MRNFIKENTELGAKSTTEVGKLLFKNMNFSLCGKEMKKMRTEK